MSRISRPIGSLAAIALVLLALTGCVKLDMELTIDSDDTIDGVAIVAFDKSLLTMGGKNPEEAFGRAEENLRGMPEGSSSEPYDDGQYYGRKIIFTDVPLSEFNTGESGAPVITHANGRYTFLVDLDRGSLEGNGVQTEMLRPFLNSMRVRFQVTFPGDVIEAETNGVVDGKTVTWDVKVGTDTKLQAVAEESSTVPYWPLLAGAGCLLAIIVVGGIAALFFRLNRKPSTPAAAPTSEASPVAPTSPPAGQDPLDR